jgi:hypothetical protein
VDSLAKKKEDHRLRNALYAVLGVVIVVGVVLATPPILFFNVTVSGTASASPGASPVNVTFFDENGAPYVAPTGAGGAYSISLQNGHTYNVEVVYSMLNAPGGNCSAGILNLNTLGWAQTNDWSC